MLTDSARAAHEVNDCYWAGNLIATLEGKEKGRAYSWAFQSLWYLLDNAGDPVSEQLLHHLSGVADLQIDFRDRDLLEEADRIWHEERDPLHTAIAHLFAALAHYKAGNQGRYRASLNRVCSVMGNHEFYRERGIDFPLTLFQQLDK
jgi:hypothetical protein